MKSDAVPQCTMVDGNGLTLLVEGRERLEALIELIDQARESLRLLYYIFLPDAAGVRVRDALLRAARRGVTVSLLIDGFGSAAKPADFFAELADCAAFCRFHPSFGRRYLLRNHQKLALADSGTPNARVIIGGFNVADDYFQSVEEGGWRDIGLTVEGPAASKLGPYYDELLRWTQDKRSKMRALRRLVYRYSEAEGKLQWQLGGPTPKLSPWGVSTCRDLAHSQDVEMIAAYFAPTWGMLRRIARVGGRGRARLITAAKSDNGATIAAARFTYRRLLRRGVEVFEYLPTKLHSKLVVLDDIVHIGSSNLDIRSLYLNMELMLRIDDPAFAKVMRSYFEREIADSLEITPAIHKRRSTLFNRARWALSFFLVTSLDYGVTRRLNFVQSGE